MLDLLYRDDHYIAINKPNGVFVHRTALGPGEASCMPVLRNQIGQWVYPVHRLDRGTSGALVFALSSEAARELARLFEQRQVKKTYLAVVRGYVPEQDRIDYAFETDDGSGVAQAVTAFTREAKVELPYPVGRYATARYSLVRVMPLTGRQHQIRRHFSHIRHPVVGDTRYGDRAHNRFFRDLFGLKRMLLMATEIGFCHPFTGAPVIIRAPLPGNIRYLFQRFGWDDGEGMPAVDSRGSSETPYVSTDAVEPESKNRRIDE